MGLNLFKWKSRKALYWHKSVYFYYLVKSRIASQRMRGLFLFNSQKLKQLQRNKIYTAKYYVSDVVWLGSYLWVCFKIDVQFKLAMYSLQTEKSWRLPGHHDTSLFIHD